MDEKVHARILLVDDEKEFIANLAERLTLRGMKVSSVYTGKDAIELTDEKPFDAIVLDLSMPGMDGMATLKKIKKLHPDTEIIMLTGHASVATSVEAMKLGASEFLEKPVDIKELTKKISEAQERHILILQKHAQEEIQDILKSKPW